MKRYDIMIKIFFAEFISLIGTLFYMWHNSAGSFRRLYLSVCMADILAESISYGIFVSMTVWLCVLFFYEEFINHFMTEQFVIRYTAKWKLYVRQVSRIVSGGIGITGISFFNYYIAGRILGLELYTWDRDDSLFFSIIHLLLHENQIAVFMGLFADALLQFLYFLLIMLMIRWFLRSRTIILILTALIFMVEIGQKGFLLTRVDVFEMFKTGEFNGLCLWQMFGIVILVFVVGWIASIRKEFYNEKK